MKFLPYGLDGGKPARPTRNVLTQDGVTRDMPGKFAVVLREGDTIRHDQPGGGGFGDPVERDPEAVAVDVRNDKVTIEHARQAYGVVIDPVTLKVDADATRAMRAKTSR
jgi:N-methylhydantoinase B